MKKLKSTLKTFFETPLGKGILTALRNAVIVGAGVLVSALIETFTGAEMDATIKLIIIGALKLVDEELHKTGIAKQGLTRF
jgi:hypothetical protein